MAGSRNSLGLHVHAWRERNVSGRFDTRKNARKATVCVQEVRRAEGGLDRSKADGMHGFQTVVLEVVVDVFVTSDMKPALTN